MLLKAEFFAGMADRERALAAFEACEQKTVAIGQKMEMVFSVMRLHIFHDDWAAVKAQVAKLKAFLEQPGGADWERKNRLKVYEGVARMACRDFEGATGLFLESLSTFTTYELMSYADFVHYACVCGVITLKRVDLKEKLIDSPEVLSVIDEIPGVGALINALHECRYEAFMRAFPVVSDGVFKNAWLTNHHRYFLREARVSAVPAELQVGDDGEHGGGVCGFGGVPGRRALQLHRRGPAQREDRQGERRARHEQAGRQERAVPVVHQGGGQLAEQDPEAQPRGGPVVAVVM
jgi:26S proteasome regulatory subunit N7